MHSGIWTRYAAQVRAGLKIDHGVDVDSHLALGIAGEAGEVADLVKKSQYADSAPLEARRGDLLEELGDLWWYMTAIMDRHGFTPADLMISNIRKLEVRRPYAGYSAFRLEHDDQAPAA